MAERICVGALAGAFGVRGEVRLKSFCTDPAAIADYGPLSDENGTRSFTVTLTGQTKNALTGRLGGITTKEQADALRGLRLFAPRDRLPGLPDDEFYHTDLIGLEVIDTGGQLLGRVSAIHNHGATDLIEVQPPHGGTGSLLPFTRDVVPTVDLAAGRLVADPPEGLFPDG
ncbi:MAG: ribosome maturation factor RimM [Qingshengfaniella sp.]